MKTPRFCKLTNDELTVSFRALRQPHTWFALPFFAVWLTFWTGGCFALLRAALEGEKFLWLFGIPFWAAEIGVFGVILQFLLFRVRLTLNREGLTYREWGIFPKKHEIPLADLKRFRVVTIHRNREWKDSALAVVLRSGEEITLGGISFKNFGSNIRDWTEEYGNEFLEKYRPVGVSELDSEIDSDGDENDSEEETPIEEFHANGRYSFVPQPEESEWVRSEEYSPFEVTRTDRFCMKNFSESLFSCVFCNGIVSVFVLSLWGVIPAKGIPEFLSAGWWGFFAFLLPFEFIGLMLFGGLLSSLFPSGVRRTLVFERGKVLRRSSWFGIPRSRTFSVENVSRYKIIRDDGKNQNILLFYDKSGAVLCKIDGLTLPDARWLRSEYRQIAGR